MGNVCPVCGYSDLEHGPFIVGTSDSYEICSSCGFEFGVTDMDEGYSYAGWREKWIQEGMVWWSNAHKPSPDWNPRTQLRNIGVIV